MLSVWQQPLPEIYVRLSEPELRVRIDLAKQELGSRLTILGHHYQQDDIIAFADFVGDSFELSRRAAEQKGVEYVVFCGVHFMAESADILTEPSVRVILPDLGAGCSMADMASLDQTLDAWEQLKTVCGDEPIVPITYMNSSAAIKAFVGEHGGAVCTSSNCRNVLEWALSGGAVGGKKTPKILFFPDQHLGRNTAYSMGTSLDKMIVWDPKQDLGGNTPEQIQAAQYILWKGHCSVHALFRPEHVDQQRARDPQVKVIVHPECKWEVVQKADLAGSTAYIVDQVRKAPAGTKWAIGTEVHLVNRLKHQHPEQEIVVLSDCQCLCTTMYRIDLPHLCWALENLVQGNVVNEIRVDERTRKWSLVALERMLSIKGSGSPISKSSTPSNPIILPADAEKAGIID
ncbi:MAG: quinolinate synthase A [Phycisphaerae bacterium]|jgi:quinolinate synthase|nr:MAG: quinolinate synthase A [Phycisphaerae bacterium]